MTVTRITFTESVEAAHAAIALMRDTLTDLRGHATLSFGSDVQQTIRAIGWALDELVDAINLETEGPAE